MNPKRKHWPQRGKRVAPPRLDPQAPIGECRAFKARQISAQLDKFQAMFDFPFDDFQVARHQILDGDADVLVTASISAGRIIIGLYEVFLTLRQGKCLFYATPVKTLSNQKSLELQQILGFSLVGLLTEGTVVNEEADIIVITIEVLRNMIYAKADLSTLGPVVMDGVHYLPDQSRGPVWEEITIYLDSAVHLVYPSATVSSSHQSTD